ncbi:MAG TPA: pyridoxal 5'-phosphate synthase glutaminase subunit PdxT [Candidatus Dormibacteraeota bacterium]|nr:pyridoxal 5'-phosphate synthase glutaminase subunit PdxT [Candidatus Dormibacteraeota bacterium]
MKIGVLAIQGDFEAHRRKLDQMGVDAVLVKTAGEMAGLDGLILPGGESTTHLKLLTEEGILGAVAERARQGMAIFGTCAGAILLAKEVKNPPQPSLGLVDMTVVRNAYGRQLDSCVLEAPTTLSENPLEMVFIRAPVIERVGPGVEILARREGKPVLVRQGRVLAATFHPELSGDSTIHSYFLKMVGNGK